MRLWVTMQAAFEAKLGMEIAYPCADGRAGERIVTPFINMFCMRNQGPWGR